MDRLTTQVRQMAKFGVEHKEIRDFAVRNAANYGLGAKQVDELNVFSNVR